MCEWLHQKLERTPSWHNEIRFPDKAHFHLNGSINNHTISGALYNQKTQKDN